MIRGNDPILLTPDQKDAARLLDLPDKLRIRDGFLRRQRDLAPSDRNKKRIGSGLVQGGNHPSALFHRISTGGRKYRNACPRASGKLDDAFPVFPLIKPF